MEVASSMQRALALSIMDLRQPTKPVSGALPGTAHAGAQMQSGEEGAAVLIWQGLVNNYRCW